MFDKKRAAKRIGVICLAGVLVTGMAGATVYAKAPGSSASGASESSRNAEDVKEEIKETASRIWQPKDGDGALLKDETVYVITAADGTTQKIIVSDRIQNGTGADSISDKTELSDVTAVKNGESYTERDGSYVWEVEGADVCYQGTTDKELPISVKITYTLDGKEVTPEELAGKSGHVVIRYEYVNNQYEVMEIGGEQEEIHVPYAVLTGMILDNTKFGNIKVSSGKVINDGTRCIVAGIAFPGMNADLGMTEETLPEYVEIEADTEDFSLGSVYTIATNEVFSSLNLEDVDTVDDLRDALSELTDAMEALTDGSSELYDGLAELYDKSGDLKDGVDALSDGAGQLSDGAVALHTGAESLQSGTESLLSGAQSLQSGASTLASGLSTLNAKSGDLTGGAAQVFNTLLATATKQLADKGINVTLTIDNYAATINGIIQSTQQQVYEAAYNGVKASVLTQVLEGAGIDQNTYDALPAGDATKAVIDQTVEEKMQTPEVQAQISALVARNASGSAAQLAELKSQLDNYNTFYQGVLAYTAGVASASSGAGQLSSGAGQLSSGAAALNSGAKELTEGAGALSDGIVTLKDGIDTLADGSDALIEGVSKLKDGAMQLRDGLATFDEEGIRKISDLAGADLDTLVERLQAISQVSRNYNSFAGISDDMDGTVKFIIKTAEIK